MNSILKTIWLHLDKTDKLKLSIVVFLTTISSFLEVISIGMIIPLITVLVEPTKLLEYQIVLDVYKIFSFTSNEELVSFVIIGFIIMTIFSTFVRIITIKISADFSFMLGHKISIITYKKILFRPFIRHKNMNSSDDISKLVAKIDTVIKSLIFPMIMLINAIIMFSFISVIFLFIEFLLTISIIFGLVLIYLMVTLYFKNKLMVNSNDISSMQNKQIQNIQESLGSIRDIIINNSYSYFLSIYESVDKKLRSRQASNIIVAQAPKYFIETLSIIFIIFIAYYFVYINNYIDKTLILPIFITVAIALQRILPIAQQAYRSWASIEGNKKALTDVLEVLDYEYDNNIFGNKNINFNNKIEIKNLKFYYHDNSNLILDDISFSISKGEVIGFIGSTGSGKSTLVDIIIGLIEPKSGGIYVDDKKLTNDYLYSWYQKISHVPQNIYILDNNIYENIAIGDGVEDFDYEKIKQASILACADDFIDKKENKYYEILGESGSKLSGGQKQRIGIARAFYRDSEIIIFDEATSALDNETEDKIMEHIKIFHKKKTILMVAHRLTTLRYCDKIIELENGKIKSISSYSEMIINKTEGIKHERKN